MSLSTYMKRLKFVDSLILRRSTGNLSCLAKKLNLSKSQTILFLKEMKEQGFPIEYSRKANSYYYSVNGRLVSGLFESKEDLFEISKIDLTNNQLRKISGGLGLYNFFVHTDYIRTNDLNFVK